MVPLDQTQTTRVWKQVRISRHSANCDPLVIEEMAGEQARPELGILYIV